LTKSHSPYYLMSQLGSNARKQGKKEEALQWYGQAYEKSEGPATRLQWGTGYLTALVELAPQDAARIERTAAQLLTEAASDTSAWDGRSGRSLQRASDKLMAWNNGGQHAAVIKRLQQQAVGLCGKLPAASSQRGSCQKLLRAPSAVAAT
jgi:hypothetical protein